MKFPKALLAAGSLASCALQPQLNGQTPSPSPAPVQTKNEAGEAGQAENASRMARAGFVRVWYFGAPGAPLITVATRSGEGKMMVIGSGIRPDRMLSYRPIRPGTYTLAVFDGSILPDADGQLPPGISPKSTWPLKVDRGTFVTAIIRFSDGKWIPTIFSDAKMDDDTGPALRIFDFLNAPGGKVSLAVGGKTKEIWATGAGLATETVLPGFAGNARFAFGKSSGGVFTVTNSAEIDLSARMSYSVILYIDRYGNDAFAVVENARAAVNQNDLEALGD